jgi:hypothetical protein
MGHPEVRVPLVAVGTGVRVTPVLVSLQKLPGATVSVIADCATLA